jgi:putative peptidoglycan lipid II flippase
MLPAGSISYLGYGLKLLNILWAITSSGIVISVFPLQSEYASSDLDALGRVTSTGLRISVILTMAICTCFLSLREMVIKVLFERGAFDAQATQAVAAVLLFYSGALYVQALFGSVTYALYALQRTGLTTSVAVCGALLNFALLIPLSQWLGIGGVALAYSIASTFNAVVLVSLLAFRFKIRLQRSVLTYLIKAAAASLVAGGITQFLSFNYSAVFTRSTSGSVILLLCLSTLFVLLYAAMLLLLRIGDIHIIRERFRTTIAAKLS